MSDRKPTLLRRVARVVAIVLALLVVLGVALSRADLPREALLATYGVEPSRFVDLEGMSVHYRDEGKGPPLVLIHGTSSSLHTWDGWASLLRDHRRIVRLDLPGYGLTGPAPDADYSAARAARVTLALLDHLGIPRADVAGNSYGGRVAMTLALAHPERVRRLVLVDAAGLSGQRPPAIFRLARTPVLNRILLHVTPRFVVAGNVAQVYGDPSRVTDALVDRYYAFTLRAGNRRALVDRFSGPPDPDLDTRLAELRLPVLLEWGDLDRWIPPVFGERLRAGIPGAQLITYPGVGHVPMEEQPEATARDADAFLSKAD